MKKPQQRGIKRVVFGHNEFGTERPMVFVPESDKVRDSYVINGRCSYFKCDYDRESFYVAIELEGDSK